MNKNTFDTSFALGEMEDSLVSEAARAGKVKKSRAPLFAAAAAALVFAIGAAIVLPKLIKPAQPEVTAEAPITTQAAPEENYDELLPSVSEPTEPEPASTEEPLTTMPPEPEKYEPQSFDTVVALSAAVNNSQGRQNGALKGLDYIYMPTRVPYGAELEDITVDKESVVVTYHINKKYVHEEDDPNRVVLIWHRNWLVGSTEEYARALHDSLSGYFYREAYGARIFQFELEMAAVWEEDGRGFELIMPGYYCEDSEVMKYKDLTKVKLDEASAFEPLVGDDDGGFFCLREQEFTYSVRTSFAYGRSWYKPEVLGEAEGRMLSAEGLDFIESIPKEQRGYDNIMVFFPQVGRLFEPVLRDGAVIVRIDVYDPITLEPIGLDITMDELRDIANGDVSADMQRYIFGDCRGAVLVDTVVERPGEYVEEAGEYEAEAYHCGFIIDCGY